MPALKELAFHFDPVEHRYTTLDGATLPSITQMLHITGHIDDRFYTEESSARGVAVHDLTAHYDLGALDPSTLVSSYKGYVLAHVAAMHALRPEFLSVEEPDAHPYFRFAGRPDRVAKIFSVKSIVEIKTGAPEPWHALQTALQAILVAWRGSLPPHLHQRLAVYEKASGRFNVQHHRDRKDFDTAMRIIKECCRL